MMLWFPIPKGLHRVAPVHSALIAIRLMVAALLLLPLVAQAAGLGRLTVQSALGQPLRAEVEIVSLQPGEEDGLVARVASPEAYRAAGMEFTSAHVNIRVAVERRPGRPVLRVTSAQPMNDPFFELLLELQWANGRLVREYTFLLDPVEYKPPQSVAAAPTPAAPVVKPTPAPVAVEAKPLPAAPATAATYEVKRGDTLSKVARENRHAGVSMSQMLTALYQANQSAFMRNNMYLMRSGHILKIPERAAVASVSAEDAARMVRAHSVEFDEYRRGLGAAVAVAPAKPAPPAERESPGRIAPKPAAPAPKEAKDQIKLSKVDKGGKGEASARAATGDDRVALTRALKESQSRVADLEKQIGDLQKLIELKNQQLALLEKKAAGKPAAEVPKPAAVAQKPEAPKPAVEAPKPAAEAPKPAAEKPKPAAPAAEAPKPAPKAPAKAAPPPPPPPSVIDEFLENPLALGGLVGVVALLGGYGWWAWRRKKATQSREGGFSAVAAASAAAAVAPAVAATTAAPSAAVAAAIQAPAPAPAIEEVDPIAEADVYLNYGRDAQAEAILKDALAMNPELLACHLKLLEIYAKRGDRVSFEQTAAKVKGMTGGQGADWNRASALGHAIDPENGLYGGAPAAAAAAAAPAAAAPTLDFDIGGATSPGVASAPATPSVDFDIGSLTAEPAAKSFSDTVVLQVPPVQEAPPPKPAPAPAAPEPAALDFDLDFNLGDTKPTPAPTAQPAATDLSSISLDLGSSVPGATPPSADPKWQEVATKLDLAKAYQEMNDKDGASELLNEVLRDGDAAQQEEARRLLVKLA